MKTLEERFKGRPTIERRCAVCNSVVAISVKYDGHKPVRCQPDRHKGRMVRLTGDIQWLCSDECFRNRFGRPAYEGPVPWEAPQGLGNWLSADGPA